MEYYFGDSLTRTLAYFIEVVKKKILQTWWCLITSIRTFRNSSHTSNKLDSFFKKQNTYA